VFFCDLGLDLVTFMYEVDLHPLKKLTFYFKAFESYHMTYICTDSTKTITMLLCGS